MFTYLLTSKQVMCLNLIWQENELKPKFYSYIRFLQQFPPPSPDPLPPIFVIEIHSVNMIISDLCGRWRRLATSKKLNHWPSATWLKCCFTSTKTVGLLGTGARDVHLHFHTAPELWSAPFRKVYFYSGPRCVDHSVV